MKDLIGQYGKVDLIFAVIRVEKYQGDLQKSPLGD